MTETAKLEALALDLTDMQRKALKLIGNRNTEGMGARMPYAEMIVAADELATMEFATWIDEPPGPAGRWLTPAGISALTKEKQDG